MQDIKNYEELVSIIVPTYNGENRIDKVIKNIKNQTYKNIELIIVNDASTDNTKEILKKYVKDTQIKVINLEKNSGPAIARNQGLKFVNGRYICFQEDDDLWHEEKLEKQIEFMREKQCAFSYTAFEYVKPNKRKVRVDVPEKLDYKKALKNTKILTNSVMFDLQKIDKKLLEMPDIYAEDIATWWNILKHGYYAYGLNEVLVYYCVRVNSRSYNKIKSARNRWKVYREIEKFSIVKSMYYFIFYAINGIIKRI